MEKVKIQTLGKDQSKNTSKQNNLHNEKTTQKKGEKLTKRIFKLTKTLSSIKK